jgi:hypothetical protein
MSGKLTLISSATASDSASVEFTSGIDSTYDEYVFYFVDINPATDGAYFSFQVNASGQSGYNETITSTYIYAGHDEADSAPFLLDVSSSFGQAQGTSYQTLASYLGNGADESLAGELHLFSPSSTTYVKHFYSTRNMHLAHNYTVHAFTAGYINTTSAIDETSFKMRLGNFDGQIYLFGVS